MLSSRRGRIAVVIAVLLVLALALGGVLASLGGAEPAPRQGAPASPASTPDDEPDDEPVAEPAGATTTLVATAVVDEVAVRPEPDQDVDAERVLDRREETSGELVFVVDEQRDDWLLVQLPVRPNGSTGWIRADDVSLSQHSFAIAIDVTTHELVLRNGDEVLLTAPVGVGTQDTPTPGGAYYVKELLQPPTPDGPYGPYAYGLSGFSNVLTSFAGGEGVIGIHGTDAPDRVGQDVSAGCLRLTNDVITAMVEEFGLPLGTPVAINA